MKPLSVQEQVLRAKMRPHRPGAFWLFAQTFWAEWGPPGKLQPTRLHQTLCQELQDAAWSALGEGALQDDLLINLPPAHGKSVFCNVLYDAWVWTWAPHAQLGTFSYSENLVMRDARRCKKLIQSEAYQRLWPLELDRNADGFFTNSAGGIRYCTTIRGQITGNHFHLAKLDDPQNPSKLGLDDGAEAAAEAETARQVWDDVLPSRRMDPERSRFVVIMQRLSKTDLTQHILDQAHPVRHVLLPLHYDPERACEADWRTTAGELLCPERYSHDTKAVELSKLSDVVVNAQHEQDPTAAGSGFFDWEDFQCYGPTERDGVPWPDVPFARGAVYLSLDAATAGRAVGKAAKAAAERSRWAFTAWLRAEGSLVLLDTLAIRDDFDVVLQSFSAWLQALAQRIEARRRAKPGQAWTPDTFLVEKKSSGEAAFALLKRSNLGGFTPLLYDPGARSKVERATAALPDVRARRVWLPSEAAEAQAGVWRIVRTELQEFPRGRTDDVVDTMSQLCEWLEVHRPSVDFNPSQALDSLQKMLRSGRGLF